ncbi:MAG: Rne/Rng family ribonuclease [Chitinophagaceae bacterium]|nr:Rne/Rng family ribonuclease [Chitinophagaceae bacterium]
MSNELIVNATEQGCRLALLKEKKIVEYHHESADARFNVGDIFLGTVSRIVPGLNAAFISLGEEKDAFLHYLDLGSQIASLNKFIKIITDPYQSKNLNYKLKGFTIEPEIDKKGKMTQILSRNQKILVQIVKESISTKGPRLSCDISIAGRYLVLVPFSKGVNVSKKIESGDERKRLSRLVLSIKPENFAVIVRTVAEKKEVLELDRDLKNLLSIWEEGIAKLQTAKVHDKIIGEMNRTTSVLRDILNESFDAIHIDNKNMYTEVKNYIKNIAPEKEKIVKLYTHKTKIFEYFGIEKQLRMAFDRTVNLSGGGYIIIEHTEALYVIDVNSGNKSTIEQNQEATALSVNIEACIEISRQLKLRDMGGIIVIDFIDMRSSENKKKVYDKLREEMETDRAKHIILPLSKFGLIQITRERVRPVPKISTQEMCYACSGTGKLGTAISISDKIEENIEYILKKQNEKKLTLTVHPYLFSYFTKGVFSIKIHWFFKYKKWIKIIEDTSLGVGEFHFYNAFGEEIETLEKKEIKIENPIERFDV